MNDGGAENSTKSLLERYIQEPIRRLMWWLVKKGIIKGKSSWKEYKDTNLTKAIELCKEDGSTKELVKSEYELTQDEMMKIAAKAKRDGIKIYIKDSKHPEKHYTKADIEKMAKPYEKILDLEEELQENPNLSEARKKEIINEIEKIKETETLSGQIKVLEDQKIDDQQKLDALLEKKENGIELTSAEENEIINITARIKEAESKIESLKEYNAPTFMFGANKSRATWINSVIQDAIDDRVKNPRDYNGDGVTDEKDEEITKSTDVKKDVNSVIDAKIGEKYGINYRDFTNDFAVQSVTCKQFATMSESLESINYGAVKNGSNTINVYIPKSDLETYKTFCPNSSPISIYANMSYPKVNTMKDNSKLYNYNFKSKEDLNKTLQYLEDKDYILTENTDGTFSLTTFYEDLGSAAHSFEQKKTIEELNLEVSQELEKASQVKNDISEEVTKSITDETKGVDITDGFESK